MKKLYLVRGLPGSGKTTFARELAPFVVEPDQFRYTADGTYVFDSDKNDDVHTKAVELLTYALRHLKMPCVAFTAAHVKVDHVLPLVALGKKYGYTVYVVECYGDYGNPHHVPDAVLAKMAREFQPMSPELATDLHLSVIRRHPGKEDVVL